MPILRETILAAMLGRPDKPATIVSHTSDCRIKPEITKLDLDLPLGNRGLVFSLHVLPGALVSFLQTGIVEKLSAGTVDVLNVALDDPDLLGKTGHRYGHGSRNQNSFQHTPYGAAQNLHFLVDVKGIALHIPVIDKSQRDDGTFSRDDFIYDEARDQYICPSGKILPRPKADLG
jgi:hypothetical protein